MSRTFIAMFASGVTLLSSCQPQSTSPAQPTPNNKPYSGTLETAKEPPRGSLQERISPPAASASPVNLEEIIELDFDGDSDFDMNLRREGNSFPTETVLLAAEYRNRSNEYRMADVDSYERLTKDRGEARRVAASFLTELRDAMEEGSAEKLIAVQEIGQRAVELGSTDPLVRAELGVAQVRTADLDDDEALVKAIEELKEFGYRPAIQLICYYHVVLFHGQRNSLTPKHGEMQRQYAIAWLKSEDLADEDLRIAWSWLGYALGGAEALGMEEAKRFVDACLEVPDLDSWLKHMLVGSYYRKLAWAYRGGGWATEVSEEGWEEFQNYLPLAGKFFTRAWQLHPEFPEAATEMIQIAMAGGDDRYSPRGWFDCAIRAQFDYLAAYGMLRSALQERWSGDPKALPLFIREVMASEQFDTEVPYWGLGLLRLDAYQGRDSSIWREPGNYEAVRKMIQGYLAYENPAISPDILRSQLAAAASYTKDYKTANDVFIMLSNEHVVQELFDEVNLNATEARYFASVMAGPAADKVAEIDWSRSESEYLQNDEIEVFEKALQALRELDSAPASQIYWNRLERPITWRKVYLTGEWVDLTFEEGLPGWVVLNAKSEVENVNSVAITATSWHARVPSNGSLGGSFLGFAKPMQLKCAFPVQPPYVVEMDIENIPPSEPFNRLGVVVGGPVPHFDGGKYLWLDTSRQRFGNSESDGEDEGENFAFQERTHIRVHVWDDEYERFLNDKRVDGGLIEGLDGRGQLGFGTVYQPSRPYSVRLSNIRVRRLTTAPPGAERGVP